MTGDFKINMKGGSDTLSIDNAAHTVPVMTLPGNLNVDLGSGDFDFVALTNASVKGSVSVTGGSGGKNLDFGYSHIGDPTFNAGKNDLVVNFNGNSTVDMTYVTVERDLTVKSNVNNSSRTFMMLLGGTVGRNTLLQTGKGNDSISTDEYYFGQKLQILTGDGNDKVVLGGYDTNYIGTIYSPMAVGADQVYVDLGKGNDILAIGGKGSVLGGGVNTNSATYLGGDGVDQVINGTPGDLYGSFTGFEALPYMVSTSVATKRTVTLAKV